MNFLILYDLHFIGGLIFFFFFHCNGGCVLSLTSYRPNSKTDFMHRDEHSCLTARSKTVRSLTSPCGAFLCGVCFSWFVHSLQVHQLPPTAQKYAISGERLIDDSELPIGMNPCTNMSVCANSRLSTCPGFRYLLAYGTWAMFQPLCDCDKNKHKRMDEWTKYGRVGSL